MEIEVIPLTEVEYDEAKQPIKADFIQSYTIRGVQYQNFISSATMEYVVYCVTKQWAVKGSMSFASLYKQRLYKFNPRKYIQKHLVA